MFDNGLSMFVNAYYWILVDDDDDDDDGPVFWRPPSGPASRTHWWGLEVDGGHVLALKKFREHHPKFQIIQI